MAKARVDVLNIIAELEDELKTNTDADIKRISQQVRLNGQRVSYLHLAFKAGALPKDIFGRMLIDSSSANTVESVSEQFSG